MECLKVEREEENHREKWMDGIRSCVDRLELVEEDVQDRYFWKNKITLK